jgi:hypothetical protein
MLRLRLSYLTCFILNESKQLKDKTLAGAFPKRDGRYVQS